jgi:hypothetical protein
MPRRSPRGRRRAVNVNGIRKLRLGKPEILS